MNALALEIELPIDEIARYSSENEIISLSVFGSAARGELRPDSDIDLLVTFRQGAPIGLMEFSRIRRELGEIIGRRVDLVTPAALKPRIKQSILDSAVLIYANN